MRTTMKSGIIHSERERVFVGFQRASSRTEMQVLVPGVCRDMERVTLITTCHSTQGCSSRVWRQRHHNLSPTDSV